MQTKESESKCLLTYEKIKFQRESEHQLLLYEPAWSPRGGWVNKLLYAT